ncbi:unnamed protein product, partial [Nesidiocoris tenuis]
MKSKLIGPDHVCMCCQNLFFPHAVSTFSEKVLGKNFQDPTDLANFINEVRTFDSNWVCTTCYKYIKAGVIPRTTANENLTFPEVPDCVKKLSPLELRMVSPYIPFMQIKSLMPNILNAQQSIKGSIVNVPVDVNEMISVLPRNFSNMSTIQIKLKRHIDHKTHYLFETIQPQKVCDAMSELVQTPLYVKHGIRVDDSFLLKAMHQTEIEFIVSKEDHEVKAVTPTNVNEVENELPEDELENLIYNDVMDDDVLIFDRIEDENMFGMRTVAPGQGKQPISWREDPDMEDLSFPGVYAGHKFDPKNKLSYARRIKFEARHRDRRSCTTDRLFFMARKKTEMAVVSCVNVVLRKYKKNGKNLSVKDVSDPNFIADALRHNDGHRFLKQIRGSPAFWEDKKKAVLAMIRQLGKPTIFFTFSAAELHCPELLSILYKMKFGKEISIREATDLDDFTKTKLVRDDPVTCVRYFEQKAKNLMKVVESSSGPFAEHYVVDSYERREFQARGSVHTHNLLYLKNAPESSIEIDDDASDEDATIIFPTTHKTKILRFRNFKEEQDPANYYREQVLLFLPWRNEQTDVLERDFLKMLYFIKLPNFTPAFLQTMMTSRYSTKALVKMGTGLPRFTTQEASSSKSWTKPADYDSYKIVQPKKTAKKNCFGIMIFDINIFLSILGTGPLPRVAHYKI